MAFAPPLVVTAATAGAAGTDSHLSSAQDTGLGLPACRMRGVEMWESSRPGIAGVAANVVVVDVVGGGSVADDDGGRAPHVPSRCRVPYYQSALP